MHLKASAIPLLALAAAGAADKVTILTKCAPLPGFPCLSHGLWTTDYGGNFFMDAGEGCRNPSGWVPGMNTICWDWGNARGHFYFDGQGKRCIKEFAAVGTGGCGRQGEGCTAQRFNEVPCTW
jgi:hypothetical protein